MAGSPGTHSRGNIGRFSARTGADALDLTPTADWPEHDSKVVPWRQAQRGGTSDDRKMTEVAVSLPPLIAELDYAPAPHVQAELERATVAIALLDSEDGGDLAAFSRFLIQTEAVSSSKIEYVEAGTEDFARAIAGSKANASATSMVAATAAITEMIDRAGTGPITIADTMHAHLTLMRDDEYDGRYAGAPRTMQNWIGGSDHSPRDAIHVPPPAETVGGYLDDLYAFANRDDMPALVQAAIVHAQFESIHPFTDGNGRIGRALINAVLRRRGLTRRTVVPLASAMVANRDRYFTQINDYRTGQLGPFVQALAEAAIAAADESRESAHRLREMPAEWRALVNPKPGSGTARLLDALVSMPILDAATVEKITGASSQSYRAIDQLEGAGLIREITGRQRSRVWTATDITAELDDLIRRIASRFSNASEK